MNVELNLLQTCGFQRTLPPVFSSAHTAVVASGNALVHLDLRTNERTIALLADAPITALAGQTLLENSEQQPISIAYAETGSTTIHLIGTLPQATPVGLCQQWDSPDVGIVHLAFIPRPIEASQQQNQQQQRAKSSCLLLSINDLPNLTITIWDPDTRTALCSLQHGLSSIPQWLRVHLPATEVSNGHVSVHMAVADGTGNDAGATAASPWAKIRALISSRDEGAYTLTVNETFRGPQIVLTRVPQVTRVNQYPGIDDTVCPCSGPPAWASDGAYALAPVHGGEWIAVLDTVPLPQQHGPQHELLCQMPWANNELVHSVISFQHWAPDLWAMVTGPGNVHWVKVSMSSDSVEGNEPVMALVASVAAPESSVSATKATRNQDTAQDLVAAILCNSLDSTPLHPFTFHHFAVASPVGDYLLVSNDKEMWTVATPKGLAAPTPGLAAAPTSAALDAPIPAEPVAKFVMPCSATRIVATVTFPSINKALVIADDASATPLDLNTDVFDPLGRSVQPCLAAPPELEVLGKVTCAVGVNGTSMMLVGFTTGVALIDWVTEKQRMEVMQIARTPRSVLKIGIEYTSRLFFLLLAPLPPSAEDPYSFVGRPITRGASPSPSKKASSQANAQQSMDRAAILVHHLDTMMRYSYVTVDLPLALDAMWDSVTEMNATIIVLARDRPMVQAPHGQQQPAPMSGLAQALANTSVMYLMSVSRDPISDSRSTPLAPSSGHAGHQVTAASSVMVTRIPDVAYSLVLAPALPGAPTRLVCCLTADGTFKVYTISTTASTSATTSSSLTPAVVSPAHSKLGAKPQLLVVGPGAIMSLAGDGLIGVRTLRDLDHAARVLAHPGGVVDVAWTRKHLVSVGTDGLVRVWKWAVDDGGARIDDAWAAAMRERVAQIRNQFLSKSTTDASPELVSAAALVRTRLDTLTTTLTKVLAENAAAPPNERLDFDEMVVNLTHAMELAEQGMQQVAQARSEVLALNAEREAEIQRIKTQCWDPMQVPGKVLSGLANVNVAVANYPVRKQDEAVVERRRQIVLHRRMQLAIDDPASINALGNKSGDSAGTVEWSSLLYPVSQLTTPERMRVQLVLLEASAETTRDQFNQRFEAVIKAKAETLAKVAEKNERIKGVQEELALLPSSSGPVPPAVMTSDSTAAPMATDLGEGEVPERILTVEDSELAGVPKYLTEEEEARLAEQRRLEAERAKNAGDDGRSRALNFMMGGVLVKDERANAIASAAAIPKPEVMESNKPKTEWTEDEKRMVKEYEKKVATVREEQEKARKALETELRKLEAAADELRQALDTKVLALLEDKLATDAQVHMAQLRALILARRMDLAHHDEVALGQLRERAVHCQRQLAAAQAELPDIKQASEVQKETLDALVKKDKELDKAYKKELAGAGGQSGLQQQQQQQSGQSAAAAALAAAAASGGGAASGIPADTLWKLYKKRTINPATGVADSGPLGEEDYIAGMTPLQWSVLNDYRNRKLQVEAEIRGAMAKLKHTQRMAENLAARAETLRMDLESVNQSIDDLEEHMIAVRFDTMDLFTIKQGQVEVPPAPVVTDYSTAVLIHRGQVEELNDSIRRLGQTKLEALKEMRNYRRGILALEWETKVLEFQAGDVQFKTRDLQLLRVTKSMQEYLRSGDEGSLATVASTLERQLEYVTGSFAHKVAEREKTAKGLERQLKDKIKENGKLTKDVSQLMGLVDARARIHQMRAGSAAGPGGAAGRGAAANPSSGRTRLEPLGNAVSSRTAAHMSPSTAAGNTRSTRAAGTKSGGESDPRLAAIAQRRQLVDLARAQAQDIAVLSHEVQRWRLKTYPAFASSGPGAPNPGAPLPKEAGAAGAGTGQQQ